MQWFEKSPILKKHLTVIGYTGDQRFRVPVAMGRGSQLRLMAMLKQRDPEFEVARKLEMQMRKERLLQFTFGGAA